MSICRPYGDPGRAKVFVIGHDPRLQRSDAQAEIAFFLDYLERLPRAEESEARKYELACAAVCYAKHLTGWRVPLEKMYFTNLCNEFLPHAPKRGTVYIPDEIADRGIQAIENALAKGSPAVILPMAQQVFYHLVRAGFITSTAGFITSTGEDIETFRREAEPDQVRAREGAYAVRGKTPFLRVCGKIFWHGDTPVIPILHVKQWPLKSRMRRYEPLMRNAVNNICACLDK